MSQSAVVVAAAQNLVILEELLLMAVVTVLNLTMVTSQVAVVTADQAEEAVAAYQAK